MKWPRTTLPKELRDDIIISGGDIMKRIMESDEPWMWEETEKERDMSNDCAPGWMIVPIEAVYLKAEEIEQWIRDDMIDRPYYRVVLRGNQNANRAGLGPIHSAAEIVRRLTQRADKVYRICPPCFEWDWPIAQRVCLMPEGADWQRASPGFLLANYMPIIYICMVGE